MGKKVAAAFALIAVCIFVVHVLGFGEDYVAGLVTGYLVRVLWRITQDGS